MRRRRPGIWRRLLTGAVLLTLGLPALALGTVWWTLPGAPHGLAASVTFDAMGVPTLRAATERDAALAMGYLHARDRLFQMEAMRRGAEGRLAEIAGPTALRLDRFSRTLGLRQAAEADFAALDADTRALLDAYAEGVNLWINQRGRLAAPEFLLLGTPEPWRPAQSLLWAKVMGLWLSGNWRTEIERANLAPRLPPGRVWDLWPADASAGRADIAGLATRVLAQVPMFGEDAPLPNSASNAWAVPGLLASDPHLGYSAPVLWYLARIELPGRTLLGATSPGVPFMVIGRNERLAWGFTTTHSDTQDVFIELPSAVIRTRDEVIRVRGAEPVTLRVRETANGPVVSDLDDPDGPLLAVRMANLEPGDTSAAGLMALNRAVTIAEARAAAARITSPPQNLMVADSTGGIAMYLTGRTPLRAEGHDGSATWQGAAWQGWVPFDDLPHLENPESGRLVNANNRVQPEGVLPFLGRDWYGDWRFRRIHQLLDAAPPDATAMARAQMDAVSLLAREALPFLATLPRGSGQLATAQALLANWTGEMRADAAQPLIWNAFARRFQALVLRQAGVPEAPASPEFLRFLLTSPEAAWWCGGDCRTIAGIALAETVADLAGRYGPDPEAWRWGRLHVARFEHPLLRFVPVISGLTRLETAVSGDNETVQRQGMRAPGWQAGHGAGLRFVADLRTPDGVVMTIATGQSGHPLSRHWGDWLARWRDGP